MKTKAEISQEVQEALTNTLARYYDTLPGDNDWMAIAHGQIAALSSMIIGIMVSRGELKGEGDLVDLHGSLVMEMSEVLVNWIRKQEDQVQREAQ